MERTPDTSVTSFLSTEVLTCYSLRAICSILFSCLCFSLITCLKGFVLQLICLFFLQCFCFPDTTPLSPSAATPPPPLSVRPFTYAKFHAPSAGSAREKAVTYEISREVPSRAQPCSGGSLGAGSCMLHPTWRVVYRWRIVFRVRNCIRRLKTMAEEGRGLHWTEDKTKLLIEIWSDEQIQQQLKGTMRNIAVMRKLRKSCNSGTISPAQQYSVGKK